MVGQKTIKQSKKRNQPTKQHEIAKSVVECKIIKHTQKKELTEQTTWNSKGWWSEVKQSNNANKEEPNKQHKIAKSVGQM